MTITPDFRTPVYCLISWGQSNRVGQVFSPPDAVPSGLPIAAVRFRPVIDTTGAQAVAGGPLLDLNVTTPDAGPPLYWGTEVQLGKDLRNLGVDVAIFKPARSGASLASFLPAAGNWNFFILPHLPDFVADVDAAYPGREQRWFLLTNQGEFEATDPDPTGANNWAANLATFRAGLEALGGFTLEPSIVTRTHSGIPAAPSLAQLRASQAVADPTFIDSDDVPITGYHYTTPAALATLGQREALRVIPRNFMASQMLTDR